MKFNLKFYLLLISPLYGITQNQFELIIPSNDNNIEGIFHPAIEIDDHIFTFTSTLFKFNFGATERLNKIDNKGNLIINQPYLDTINPFWVSDVFKTDNGFYDCGQKLIRSDNNWSSFLFSKVDNNMDTLWTNTIRTNYNSPHLTKIIQLKNSNIFMIGSDGHRRTTGGSYPSTQNAVFILSNNLGNIIKYIHLNKPDTSTLESLLGLFQDSEGNIYACGQITYNTLDVDGLLIKFDQEGNVIWRKTYKDPINYIGFGVISEQKDGSLLLFGITANSDVLEHHNTYNILINIDKNGKVNWRKDFMQEYYSAFANCVEDKQGNFICGGTIIKDKDSQADGCLIKFSPQGDSIWTRIYGHRDDVPEQFFNIALASDGGYYLTGYNWVKGDHSSKSWIVKTDSNGCLLSGCATGIIEKEKYKELFVIAPNPMSDNIQVYLNDETRSEKKYIFECYDQNGRMVLEKSISGMKSVIDVSFLSSGMYFYRIHDSRKVVQSGKMVKGL